MKELVLIWYVCKCTLLLINFTRKLLFSFNKNDLQMIKLIIIWNNYSNS